MQSLHLISQGVQGKTLPHISAYLCPHEHSKYRPSSMRMITYRFGRSDGAYRQVRVIARAVAVVGPLHEEDGVASGGLGMDGKGP